MATIDAGPVAPLLNHLLAHAEASDPATTPSVAAHWNGLTGEDEALLMRSRTDDADFYARTRDVPLAVSRETGDLLSMLARSSRATSVAEFGTSFGLSTIYPAYLERVRAVGGGYQSVAFADDIEPSIRL